MKISGLGLLFFAPLLAFTAAAGPLLTVTDQTLHPLAPAVFGQFLERPSWGGEYGPEAVCDASGQLPPSVETALAGLHAPLVRFPVGTDGDFIDWQDLIDLSDRAQRPVTVGHKGGAITNRFGFPEYFALAARQGWQTLLVANLRDALYRKKPLPEAAAHAAGLLRYGLDHAPAGSVAAFQIGNEGWFFWPPAKPEERAALGLSDDTAAADWLRTCLVAYAEAARAVSPTIPLICDAPRPLDGGGLENNAASVWRAAVDHPAIRSRYQLLAAHAYAPLGLWTTERAGEKVPAADLSPDEIWLAALSSLGRFDPAGQNIADRAAYDDIAALGYRAAVTEWNWNGWDWQKKFPHAGFGDGLPAALGAAGFLHGLMRSPHVALATQSMMLGTTWGITGVRVAKDGTVGYLPQAEAVRLHAAHHGTHVVSSQLTEVPDLGPAPRLTTWWPPAEHVAQLDALVTADAHAWYVHLLHRHRTEPTTLTLRLPASAPAAGDATLHLLTGESNSTTSHPSGGFTRTEHSLRYERATLTVALPPAALAVLVIPRPQTAPRTSHSPTVMHLDLELVPFSLRGAWFGLSRLPAPRAAELGKAPALYLRTYRGNVPMNQREIATLSFLDAEGRPLTPDDDVQPGRLRFSTAPEAFVEFAFADTHTLVLHGKGLPLRLAITPTAYDYARPAGTGLWELNLFSQRLQLLLQRQLGSCSVEAPWAEQKSTAITVTLGGDSAPWQATLTEFFVTPPPPPSDADTNPAAIVNRNTSAAAAFTAAFPAVPTSLAPARDLAGYVLWSSLVEPSGHLRREGMLMSKNWMTNIWSWDHCFNAIALAPAHPALAWDQWAVMFDHQHPTGALPDTLNDRDLVLNFTKPPVHGWALREMLALGWQPSPAQLKQAAHWLELWTDWWFTHRDDDRDGLPQYNHGNDSGWDNASCFGAGTPVEGPDLATFLIVQMDVLADLHQRLGNTVESIRWMRRADALVPKLLAHSWRGDRFVAPRSGDHVLAAGDSLVAFMPLLLGRRLPPEIRDALVAGLADPGRFLTAHGLATESPRSPLYRSHGYWRGPIWAPSTQLIVSALDGVGETKLAREVSRRFCATFAKSGSAENYDALTGEGLCDRAYTWTASAFITLAASLYPES